MDSLKLVPPFTLILAGPSGSGKSQFVKKLIENKMIKPFLKKLVWCYGVYQTLYEEMTNISFHEGIPSNLHQYLDALIVIDDLMGELGIDSQLTKVLVKFSHHRTLSIIFVAQNIFHKGKEFREISLKAHNLVLFKNRRD
ncbi:uncharacterized protein TNIN_438641 [Trichonephila inaurata madagascariensis]|uniref:Uncharacterized protein n=1 Tax=Trichonephila inaurata madagascariensis TaxID=2747483 RepID=A0A8X7BZH1_9ARAC|nr:uncharacterized protein TNIN_438641 [Trichonephila inaurata madagascariensis]